uniref:Uncharacterized protein n=1 Tax=Pseudomonas fluorescens (strain SBW25) TaxID=216595 RepID=A0A0G4E5K1_PSEFS|nr:hypothetical protein PQBR55_0106 [Pseudomonas fluorescens SBW25]
MLSGVDVGPNATLAKFSTHIAEYFTDTGFFRIEIAFDHDELLSENDMSELWESQSSPLRSCPVWA